jgi:hypothetical protein
MIDGFVASLVGLPWQRDGLHCWALVTKVQRDLFDRSLPVGLTVAPESKLSLARLFVAGIETETGWQEVPVPAHGAVALMHRHGAAATALIHCGCWLAIDGGGVLHTDDPHGVVFDDLAALRARNWCARWFIPKA